MQKQGSTFIHSKTVVEEVENLELEITLKDANKINKKLTVGDESLYRNSTKRLWKNSSANRKNK